MELLLPKLGLFVWTLFIFLCLFFILKKFAWKPIIGAIKAREESIENSLQEAKKAREEMTSLKSENEALLREARETRDKMIREAREIQEKLVNDAKTEAQEEANRIIENARKQIESERMAAITGIKNMVGQLSLEIAEKVLRQELANPDAQKASVEKLVNELNLN